MTEASQPCGLRGLLGEPERIAVLSRGEAVFRRGDPASAVYEVLEGRIRLERSAADGSPLVLGVLLPGDGLAEASIFGTSYHCDATAEVASRLAMYRREVLLERLWSDPELSAHWLARASGEVRRLRALLEVRGIRPLSERLVTWLRLRDDGVFGVGAGPRRAPGRPLRALADELGVSPEALYRALASLEDDGIVRRDGRALHLVEKS